MTKLAQSITLRAATPNDEAFLFDLFASTRDEFNILEEKQKQQILKMQYDARRLQYDAGYPQAEVNIILFDNRPAGRILINEGEQEFTLVDIALLPEYRGRGIGTQLLQNLLARAVKASKPVKLQVFRSNPALQLYERLGFRQVSDQSIYCDMIFNA